MRDVAEAYVFAYPLVLSAHALRAPNQLFVSRSSANMLRLTGWLDLAREPQVISVPDTFGRYYVIWLRDAWHSAFASVGARTTGTGARAFAVLGPHGRGIRLPGGLSPLAADTPIVHVSGCIEAADAADLGVRVCPLSRWHGIEDGVPSEPGEAYDAVAEVEGIDARSFFAEAAQLSDALRDVLDADDLEAGARRGLDAIRAAQTGEPVGGWRVSYDRGRYGTDYLRRAAAARAGLEPATDELPAVADADADGRPLTGRHRYVLRFPANAEPPVNAFWSLSTSAGTTGDRDGLIIDPDGALSIHIQREPPAQAANWLPAPAGPFSVALRLYWPREEALDGHWSPPAVALASPAR